MRIWNGQSRVCLSGSLAVRSSGLTVSVFSKTLFTPAGIDIYVRSTPSASEDQRVTTSTKQRQALLEKVIAAVHGVENRDVAELAKKGFQIPGVV